MGADFAIVLARHLLMEAFILGAPMLAAACVVSLSMSLLQTLTGVQDQTLTTVPRLLVVVAVIAIAMPWTVHRLSAMTLAMWVDLARYTR